MSTQAQTIRRELLGITDIFVDPGSCVRLLDGRGGWILPLLIVGLGSVFLGYANLHLVLRIIQQNLPPGLSADQATQILENADKYQRIGISIAPILWVIKWTLSACILYISCTLLDVQATFRKLFAFLAQCSLITFLEQLTIYTIIKSKGDEVITVADLSPPLGLDILVGGLGKVAMAVLNYFSVFNLWYILILTLGLSVMTGCSKRRAFIATIPNWLIPLVATTSLAWVTK